MEWLIARAIGFQISLVICYLFHALKSCLGSRSSRGNVTSMRHSQKFALQNHYSWFTHLFWGWCWHNCYKPFPFHGVEWLEKTSSSWPFMQHGLQPTTLSNDLKLAHRTVKIDVNSVGIIKDKSPDIARNMNKHLTCLRNGDIYSLCLFVQCSFTQFKSI